MSTATGWGPIVDGKILLVLSAPYALDAVIVRAQVVEDFCRRHGQAPYRHASALRGALEAACADWVGTAAAGARAYRRHDQEIAVVELARHLDDPGLQLRLAMQGIINLQITVLRGSGHASNWCPHAPLVPPADAVVHGED